MTVGGGSCIRWKCGRGPACVVWAPVSFMIFRLSCLAWPDTPAATAAVSALLSQPVIRHFCSAVKKPRHHVFSPFQTACLAYCVVMVLGPLSPWWGWSLSQVCVVGISSLRDNNHLLRLTKQDPAISHPRSYPGRNSSARYQVCLHRPEKILVRKVCL